MKKNLLSRSFTKALILTISTSAATTTFSQSIVGTWQGTLPEGENPRIVLKLANAGNGSLRGSIIFIDRGSEAYPLLSADYRPPEVTVAIGEFSFRGKLSVDGKSIAGTWTRGDESFPVTFALANSETLWAYSGPSTIPAMSATADPAFEVATIKPSPPDAKTRSYSWKTHLFQARDDTVSELIQFAYQVRSRQIEGGPPWIDEFRFDITGEPDAPGLPSFDQQRLMLRKLLADRCGLKVHIVQRDFPVYALVIQKGPPKIEASSPAGSHMSVSPRELEDGNTAIQFSYTTMPDFADFLMNFIQDRQILDETGLAGRFDFTMVLPPAGTGDNEIDKANAFLLGVEPLGFKLLPKKEPLEVLVIDHVDKPTAN